MAQDTVNLSDYDEDVIAKAFWLQEHIRRTGLDGVNYSQVGEGIAETQGDDIVAQEISKELKKI